MNNDINSQRRLIVDILASKWVIRIMYTLGHDTKRFSEIHKAIPEATQKMLTEALRKLERNGLIDRHIHPVIPPQVEYKLTALGRELLKLTDAISQWADSHAGEIKRAQKSYDCRKKS